MTREEPAAFPVPLEGGAQVVEGSSAAPEAADELPTLLPGSSLNPLIRVLRRVLRTPFAEVHLLENGRARIVAGGPANGAAAGATADAGEPCCVLPWCEDVCASGVSVLVSRSDETMEGRPAGAPRIVAFAGVPMRSRTGQLLGALCVGDVAPRDWSEDEIRSLHELAAAGAVEVELRRELAIRRKTERQLMSEAFYDPLTRLPNRLLFMERLGHAMVRARRYQDVAHYAVLFLDLDRFKVVNDSLGHHVGDELLVAVAGRLRACLRTEDTVARLGGDEFAVLIENIGDVTDATRVAERIRQELSTPVNLSGYEVFASTSIGIALGSAAYDRPEYLLRNADMAMYRAKAAGLGHFEVFDRTMHAEALARLQLETDLRRAVERCEFHLQYQPIISLESGRVTGFEALLRWHHPAQGPISPADFIPVAEETGLILPLGTWVLREACRRLREWQQRFPREAPLSVSVNLSVKQFSQPNLVEQVREVLRETGLDPRALKLEITESVIVMNTEFATRMLQELKALGVQIFMDDFGTGYSSLSYLHRLPLDTLKIDRSFIGEMETDGRTNQLVRTILTLARGVGMHVVAEGVEAEGQLRELRSLGCEFGQGFYFSRPLDPAAIEELLARDPRW